MKQKFKFSEALKTALGMSFISMISMEIMMQEVRELKLMLSLKLIISKIEQQMKKIPLEKSLGC